MFSRLILFIFFAMTACGFEPFRTPSTGVRPQPLPPSHLPLKVLSLYDSSFTTCNHHPQTKIFHFPMYHFPTDGRSTKASFEIVVRSQFKLLHTILNNYGNVVIFEEQVAHDHYNSETIKRSGTLSFTRLDNQRFFWSERIQLARRIFRTVPLYYEHLTNEQKQYLYNTGGVLTLFFMGHVDHVYKTITSNDFDKALHNLIALSRSYKNGLSELISLPAGQNRQSDYWLYDYRENKLKLEVLKFYQQNPNYRGLILIAYGANHDFSDDFAGFSFATGNHCL